MKTRSELVEFLTSYIEKAPNKVLSLLYHFVINYKLPVHHADPQIRP